MGNTPPPPPRDKNILYLQRPHYTGKEVGVYHESSKKGLIFLFGVPHRM